jgi:predicted RNase H-like nuclease (RuvC/YqgF family)
MFARVSRVVESKSGAVLKTPKNHRGKDRKRQEKTAKEGREMKTHLERLDDRRGRRAECGISRSAPLTEVAYLVTCRSCLRIIARAHERERELIEAVDTAESSRMYTQDPQVMEWEEESRLEAEAVEARREAERLARDRQRWRESMWLERAGRGVPCEGMARVASRYRLAAANGAYNTAAGAVVEAMAGGHRGAGAVLREFRAVSGLGPGSWRGIVLNAVESGMPPGEMPSKRRCGCTVPASVMNRSRPRLSVTEAVANANAELRREIAELRREIEEIRAEVREMRYWVA